MKNTAPTAHLYSNGGPEGGPTARRLAPLLLTGLAVLAALILVIPWAVQVQAQEVTPTSGATGDHPPAKPTNLQASAEHEEVTLTWTASTDQTVTHYAILRRNRDTDALGVFHVIDSNAGPETSYTDRSVAAASRYGYRVKSVSPTGVSQWSGFVKADTPAAPDPTPTPTTTPEPTATPTPTPTPTPSPTPEKTSSEESEEETPAGTVLWSATMTVGTTGTGSTRTAGYTSLLGDLGAITEDSFEFDGVATEVRTLALRAGELYLLLGPRADGDYVLQVDDDSFNSGGTGPSAPLE